MIAMTVDDYPQLVIVKMARDIDLEFGVRCDCERSSRNCFFACVSRRPNCPCVCALRGKPILET